MQNGELTVIEGGQPVERPTTGATALAPANMADAIRLAEMMAGAKLVPQHLQGKPADCFLIIEQSARWGLSPFAVAQETAVISGRVMYSGKLVAGVVNCRGDLAERLTYDYDGAGDNRTVKVTARLRGEREPRTVDVRLGDVRTQNGVWKTQPDQQLAYAGARIWARRHMPELMLGVYTPEEELPPPVEEPVTLIPPKREVEQAAATPPAPAEPPPTPAPRANPQQVKELNIALRAIGLGDDREKRLAWLQSRVGHPVASSKDLSYDEVQSLIAAARDEARERAAQDAQQEGEREPGADE